MSLKRFKTHSNVLTLTRIIAVKFFQKIAHETPNSVDNREIQNRLKIKSLFGLFFDFIGEFFMNTP
jgi:hypothetical protein